MSIQTGNEGLLLGALCWRNPAGHGINDRVSDRFGRNGDSYAGLPVLQSNLQRWKDTGI